MRPILTTTIALLLLFCLMPACKKPSLNVVGSENIFNDTLTVLSFNILYGGDEYDFSKTVEAVKKSGAQVACIQEAEGQLQRLADSLGWKYTSKAGHIISQFPLYYHKDKSWYYTLVMPSPNHVFAISNIHLPSDPYGPEAVRDSIPQDSLTLLEKNTRMEMLNMYLPVWDSLLSMDLPLVVAGDLNSPSHRDWIPEMVGKRPHLRYSYSWPVTKAIEEIGMIDHYRTIFPNPVTHPACTWTPGYPYPKMNAKETHDRIDFIFGSETIIPLSALLLGEKDNPEVNIAIDPYPTDHRGVISKMVIPTKVSSLPLISFSDQVTTSLLPSIRTSASTYTVGTPIEVIWENAPANRYDWIVIYPKGTDQKADYYAVDQEASYLLWNYTFAKASGTLTLDETSHAKFWPLPAGQYQVCLLKDDGFEMIVSTNITIQK